MLLQTAARRMCHNQTIFFPTHNNMLLQTAARRMCHKISNTLPPPPRLSKIRSRPKSFSSSSAQPRDDSLAAKNQRTFLYLGATAIGVVGLAYAAVPLYKVFCQATGFGGEIQRADIEKFEKMTPSTTGRLLRITFNADTSDSMPWSFRPSQRYVEVHPGETALAFFRAKNKTDKPVTGVATYNVTPMRAGVYFNKIQCFCFEEQRLKPNEEVDMPVFFYVDPKMEVNERIFFFYYFFYGVQYTIRPRYDLLVPL